MTIKTIQKSSATARISLLDETGNIIADFPPNLSIVKDQTEQNIVRFCSSEKDEPIASMGFKANYTQVQIDNNPPNVYTGTFDEFIQDLRDNVITGGGGSGGGGGGDATAANQVIQNGLLTSIEASNGAIQVTALQTFNRVTDIRNTNDLINGSTNATSVAIGSTSDAAETNPANPATVIGALKGIVANTAKPTQSNHYRNSGTTNTVVVKVGQVQIIGGYFVNRTAGTKYLRIYDSTLPTPALTPVLEVAAIQGASVQIPARVGFISGLSYIVSASANQAGAQLTTADAASVQIIYS